MPELRRTAACTATTLTLEARLLPEDSIQRVTEKLVEPELWFVHKAPDGKDNGERQVVRMRDGGRGDFYFECPHLSRRPEAALTIAVGSTC